MREGLGRLPLPKLSVEAPEPGISAEDRRYPSGLGLGHFPGLSSGALHLQPDLNPVSSKHAHGVQTFRADGEGSPCISSLHLLVLVP